MCGRWSGSIITRTKPLAPGKYVGAPWKGSEIWAPEAFFQDTFAGKFTYASPFFKGLAHVKILSSNQYIYSGTFVYIDRNGKTVFKYDR
jgi:hypothetical protein